MFTAKGSHVGSGEKVVNMIVAIYYRKGVIYYQYEKLDGDYVAQFVDRKYWQMFGKSGKEGPEQDQDRTPDRVGSDRTPDRIKSDRTGIFTFRTELLF